MDSRREFLKKVALLSGGAGLMGMMPASIQKALAINPDPGSTWLDAEHIVFLMQENRSFDHCFGTLQGVRGFNDPRAISLPNQNPVWLQTNADSETYAPFRLDMHNTKATWMGGLPHSWSDQVDARNSGKYDKWLIAKHYGNREYKNFPMTMGYYTREDLPFYYALADAFTVCDQHFCSSLTGTTPNRLYFWTGTIREDANSKARVWNGDTDYEENAAWTTYPERLEQNGISWRIYQNELSAGGALTSDQDAWLANFTDNSIEWFEQYHVKLTPTYIDYLQKAPELIGAEIDQLERALQSATGKKAEDIQKRINNRKQTLQQKIEEQKVYTRERYEQLSEREKNLLNKAFTTNSADPDYHELATLKYKDGDTERELVIPKGDILHEFRKDVNEGKLPTVSWLVAPEKFSDHPSAPWFGAWYVSEVLDILTKNPEVWKKTIFVLTYDENDGYFDHVPPFISPHKPGSGKASEGIDTAAEYVSKGLQSSETEDVRENAIGLGYRVPMVIASPWSRGGWVNSQVFDHTSNLQLLEKFLQHKIGKPVKETNITEWRRCVCGDLTSVFRPHNGEKIEKPKPVEREPFIEGIYNAKFKKAPEDWSPLSETDVAQIKQNLSSSPLLPQQEKGTRSACALPYELYADGELSADKKTFNITVGAGKNIFGDQSAGAPFSVYAPGKYAGEVCSNRDYAVRAGDKLNDQWTTDDFENSLYHLRVYGPNGFFRAFTGSKEDPPVSIQLDYERTKTSPEKLTGNIVLTIKNISNDKAFTIDLADKSYKKSSRSITVNKANPVAAIIWDLKDSFNWYDIAIKVQGYNNFEKRYAGRVETGQPGKTDPLMGRMV
ncbi:phospholipase C, phosphocholine-specific [Ilyomonas limi]|uniref:phospholipase C n=2 Tax=Ilyomonas limi TaxID=2575867 RepID=A0A4U3L4Z5_9BACT|nr:phospholipase C, phosphocholine-specific [Ilyomonas limi]